MMKYVALGLIAIALVASVLVVGCTANVAPSPSPSTGAASALPSNANSLNIPAPNTLKMPTGAQANLSKTITDRYALNYEIITPFSMHTNQYGNIIYTGVVQDNKSAHIKAYRHSITIEQIKTRNQTIERAKQWALLFASQGVHAPVGAVATSWAGVDDTGRHAVNLMLVDPTPSNAIGRPENNGYFTIEIDDQTLLA
jgi:hypothetical protein